MFLIKSDLREYFTDDEFRLNPLNQVYVFNYLRNSDFLSDSANCLNPLNQVYVFNQKKDSRFFEVLPSGVLIP